MWSVWSLLHLRCCCCEDSLREAKKRGFGVLRTLENSLTVDREGVEREGWNWTLFSGILVPLNLVAYEEERPPRWAAGKHGRRS